MAAKRGARLVLAPRKALWRIITFAIQPGDIILLGRESAGVPDSVHDAADARVAIPLRPGLRSLNVAVAGGILVAEALGSLTSSRQWRQVDVPSP